MKPFPLISVLAALISPAVAQHRLAMLVAIDDYGAAVKNEAPALGGALSDIQNMGEMLSDAGYQVVLKLPQKEATKAAILAGLEKLGRQAAAGDTVLFYFSGRGSAMHGPSGSVATLVPHDYVATKFDNDVPITKISAWADRLQGVHVVVVIDACFVRRPWQDKDVIQQEYNHNPRVIERIPGISAPAPFTGNAVYLCACDPGGSAYETKFDANAARPYAGAFTYSLLGTERELWHEGYGFQDIFDEVRRQFLKRGRDGFMPDEKPTLYDPARQIAPESPFLWAQAPEDRRWRKSENARFPRSRRREHRRRSGVDPAEFRSGARQAFGPLEQG